MRARYLFAVLPLAASPASTAFDAVGFSPFSRKLVDPCEPRLVIGSGLAAPAGFPWLRLFLRLGVVGLLFRPVGRFHGRHVRSHGFGSRLVLAVHGRGIPLIGLDGGGRDDDWFTHHRLRDGVLFDGRG